MSDRTQDMSRCVLVACGMPSLLEALISGLSSRNYRPYGADSGQEVLDLLRRRRFGALIVEFSVTGIEPLPLIEAVRRMHPQITIVAVLNQTEEANRESAVGAGASEVCMSPSSGVELDVLLQRSGVAQAILHNRLSSVRSEVLQKAIRAIAAVVDTKMGFSSRHSANVTEICMAMAVEMALPPEQMALLELAAQIHDIGMVAVPEDVAAKPDRLEDIDWVDVLKHPALGSAMLSGVPELAEVAAAIRHHHERVDGQGYPDGLFGEAIPLFARMIAVADAYDAMTSQRPHRPARSHTEAITELRHNAGKQFDSEYVELLINVTDIRSGRQAA